MDSVIPLRRYKRQISIVAKTLTIILKLSVTAWLCIAIGFSVGKEFKKAQLKALNYYMPHDYAYLINLGVNQGTPDLNKLKQYEYYFQKVTAFMPFVADAFAMQGYCQYYLRQNDALSGKSPACDIAYDLDTLRVCLAIARPGESVESGS